MTHEDAKRHYHMLLDQAFNETKEGDSVVATFVNLAMQELKPSAELQGLAVDGVEEPDEHDSVSEWPGGIGEATNLPALFKRVLIAGITQVYTPVFEINGTKFLCKRERFKLDLRATEGKLLEEIKKRATHLQKLFIETTDTCYVVNLYGAKITKEVGL